MKALEGGKSPCDGGTGVERAGVERGQTARARQAKTRIACKTPAAG